MGAVRTFCLVAVGLCVATPAMAQQPMFMGPPMGYNAQVAMTQPVQGMPTPAGPMGAPMGSPMGGPVEGFNPMPQGVYAGPMPGQMGPPMGADAYMGMPYPGEECTSCGDDCCMPDCGDCGKKGCKGGCCGSKPCPLLFIGVEATALMPSLSGNFASATFISQGAGFPAGATAAFSDNAGIDDQLGFAPRVFAQLQNSNGWGVAIRYWQFDLTETQYVPLTTNTLPFFSSDAQQSLEMAAADFELTRCWNSKYSSNPYLMGWTFQQTLGLRYAKFEHDASVDALIGATGPNTLGLITATGFSELEGLGVTTSVAAQKSICYGLGFYFSARGSVVWGDSQVYADSATSVNPIGGVGIGGASLESITGNDELFIGEAQIGLQYEQPLAFRPGFAFIRCGFEYQYWTFGSDLVADTARTSAVAGNMSASATSIASGPELSLFGLSASAGVTW